MKSISAKSTLFLAPSLLSVSLLFPIASQAASSCLAGQISSKYGTTPNKDLQHVEAKDAQVARYLRHADSAAHDAQRAELNRAKPSTIASAYSGSGNANRLVAESLSGLREASISEIKSFHAKAANDLSKARTYDQAGGRLASETANQQMLSGDIEKAFQTHQDISTRVRVDTRSEGGQIDYTVHMDNLSTTPRANRGNQSVYFSQLVESQAEEANHLLKVADRSANSQAVYWQAYSRLELLNRVFKEPNYSSLTPGYQRQVEQQLGYVKSKLGLK